MNLDKKRKASTTDDKKAPPTKSRKLFDPAALPAFTPVFTPQATATPQPSAQPNALTGAPFHAAIAQLRDGGMAQVSTRFNLKVKAVGETRNIPVTGDYSVHDQGRTGLVQGMLQTPSNTTYTGDSSTKYNNVVFPNDLSPQRARLESRAIKQLADAGPGYSADAKVSQLDELPGNATKRKEDKSKFPLSNTLGTFALTSHLEDITAKRAVGLEDVGSAMRARVMATKWQMTMQGTDKAGEGFQSTMLNAFPQLGNTKVEAVGLKQTGIAALKKHWEDGGDTFSWDDQKQNIQAAHIDAQHAASDMFAHKIGGIDQGKITGGKWWASNYDSRIKPLLPDLHSDQLDQRESAQKQLGDISQEYVQRKMQRHGIRFG
jgi:hypothetical protein